MSVLVNDSNKFLSPTRILLLLDLPVLCVDIQDGHNPWTAENRSGAGNLFDGHLMILLCRVRAIHEHTILSSRRRGISPAAGSVSVS